MDKTSFENCKSYEIYRRTVCQKPPASKSVLLNGRETGKQNSERGLPIACNLRRTVLKVYLEAVKGAFSRHADCAVLIKIYGASQGETRYSPAGRIGCESKIIQGKPDMKPVPTSYLERQNLTLRMQVRRFTRLTNGLPKKVENYAYAPVIFYMHYSFCRIHQTPHVTPAMEAGVTNHVRTIEEAIPPTDDEASSCK